MELKKITNTVFYSSANHEIDQPCLYAVLGSERTLMIDGGVAPDAAREFVSCLRRQTGRGVDYVAVTHWHWDHTFGLAGIDAPMLACSNTAMHLKRMQGYASWSDEALASRMRTGEEISSCAENIKKVYPGQARGQICIRQPDIVFKDALELQLGGMTCELMRLPAVHTNDSIAIHARQAGVLFLGDDMSPSGYDHPCRYSAEDVTALMAYIRGTGAKKIAVSHVEPAGLEEFLADFGILETAAAGVLSGVGSVQGMMGYFQKVYGDSLPEDAAEVAELFINGIA